ncbi:thioredoxin family protein [Acidipila sp. 4G-K13]|uniref:Disulfide bond formation protein DsbD n=2 Tax=Paracidobacterium acidisoli TaxID=2303751 RepID=A0A372IR43_9BACT|nr:thioredoxin family protein [Paracidobacterium acidisoli]
MRTRLQFALLIFVGVLFAVLQADAATPASAPGPSADSQHLTLELVSPAEAIYPGESFHAGLYFRLESGWHVYWTNAGDSGEPPSAQWTLPAGVTASPIQFPTPRRLPLGPLMDFGYEHEVLFPVPMQVAENFRPAGSTAVIAAKVSWLVCREVCLPGKAEVALTRKVLAAPPSSAEEDASAKVLFTRFAGTMPQPLPATDKATFSSTSKEFTLAVQTGSRESSAEFFPFDQTIIANAAPQPAKPLSSGIALTLTKDDNIQSSPKELHGLVVFPNGKTYEIHAVPGRIPDAPAAAGLTEGGPGTLIKIAGFAFLGGIILNLMPCVFPVLFIKGLALVNSSQHERRQMRLHGWVYTLGIVASFWAVVALLLILRGAGQQLGWGFQFQSPTFIAVMALLLFFLGLSLAGQFEIGLSLTSAGGSLANKGGYAGSFFTGVLAMVVATPCTAPFMGAAIGYALSHSALVSFVVFTALALGLAAPYLLLAYNPRWTKLLPRPGAWMEILKQAVSVPIFGTIIWLVWLFTQLAGTNALLGLLAGFLLLAITGWVLGRWPAKPFSTICAALLVILSVAAPVYAVRNLSSAAMDHVSDSTAKSSWQPFSPALVEQYRMQGRPMLVDFTASWCLSCQVNERVVLDRPDVQQRLKDSGIVLIRADWTRHDESIAQALAALGRSGIPTYVLYDGSVNAQPRLLPEVLTPGIVFSALDSLPKVRQQSAQLVRPSVR